MISITRVHGMDPIRAWRLAEAQLKKSEDELNAWQERMGEVRWQIHPEANHFDRALKIHNSEHERTHRLSLIALHTYNPGKDPLDCASRFLTLQERIRKIWPHQRKSLAAALDCLLASSEWGWESGDEPDVSAEDFLEGPKLLVFPVSAKHKSLLLRFEANGSLRRHMKGEGFVRTSLEDVESSTFHAELKSLWDLTYAQDEGER